MNEWRKTWLCKKITLQDSVVPWLLHLFVDVCVYMKKKNIVYLVVRNFCAIISFSDSFALLCETLFPVTFGVKKAKQNMLLINIFCSRVLTRNELLQKCTVSWWTWIQKKGRWLFSNPFNEINYCTVCEWMWWSMEGNLFWEKSLLSIRNAMIIFKYTIIR